MQALYMAIVLKQKHRMSPKMYSYSNPAPVYKTFEEEQPEKNCHLTLLMPDGSEIKGSRCLCDEIGCSKYYVKGETIELHPIKWKYRYEKWS